MTVGDFFSEHRKAIDARKTHLSRVGIAPEGAPPLRDAMPSQADALALPATTDRPLLELTHAPPAPPEDPPKEYAAPKLPKLPGVNARADEE